jgi:hypothetical protein
VSGESILQVAGKTTLLQRDEEPLERRREQNIRGLVVRAVELLVGKTSDVITLMGPAAFDSNLFWTIHVVYVENILALAAPQFSC